LVSFDPDEAERVLSAGLSTARLCSAEFPEDLQVRSTLSSLAINLGYLQTNNARWSEALQTLNEAVSQSEAVVERDRRHLGYHSSLATALGCRSTALLGLGRIDEARADADRGVELFQEVRRSIPKHPMTLAGAAACLMQRAEVDCAIGDWPSALETADKALALAARRNDIAQQAFETYWHIARLAQTDSGLVGEERTETLDMLLGKALGQLEFAIQLGFGDLKRLETHADYEGLRSHPRFQGLTEGLRAKSD
jgi:tetratricopeptide (TPR) repeat protein